TPRWACCSTTRRWARPCAPSTCGWRRRTTATGCTCRATARCAGWTGRRRRRRSTRPSPRRAWAVARWPACSAGCRSSRSSRGRRAASLVALGWPGPRPGVQGERGMALSALRVMVVEDHRFQRRMALRLLAELGIEHVQEAGDGAAALALLRHLRRDAAPDAPEVVLVDLDMPGMDGVELIEHVAR